MTVSFDTEWRILKVLASAAGEDRYHRQELVGVRAECDPGKLVTFIATDRRMLAVFEDCATHDATSPASFTIPRELIDALSLNLVTVTWNDETCKGTVSEGRMSIEFTSSELYPPWRTVIPSPVPTRFPENLMLNHKLIGRAIDIAAELLPSENPQLIAGQEEALPGMSANAVVLTGEHLTIVIMPIIPRPPSEDEATASKSLSFTHE